MKNFFKLFGGIALGTVIGVSLLFMACASTGGSASVEATSGEETIVCLGDSFTSGAGLTVAGKDDKSKAWPAVLQNKVNIPVINAGVSGDTTAKGLARVKKDVLSQNPRIVIIFLGGNDFTQKIPLSTTKNNFQKIIDMVNDGSRKIYLVRFYNDWSKQSMDMYNELAASNNIEMIEGDLIDWVGFFDAPKAADKFHPGVEANELFAECVFNVLKPYLEANNLLKK
jgi:acyl-CoA thioesterase-1